jgi:hypothetical protein
MQYQRSRWKDGIPPKTAIIGAERYVRNMRKLRKLRLRNSHFRPGYKISLPKRLGRLPRWARDLNDQRRTRGAAVSRWCYKHQS